MFIHGSGVYLPERVVDNEYFSRLTGRAPDWFVQRTGIRARRRAAENEDIQTMSIAAIESLLAGDSAQLDGVDLIVAGSYTPVDTIGTLAHVVQRRFDLRGARAVYLSTACSSFLDALDMVATYAAAGRTHKALIVAAEHNSAYSRDEDEKSGHLWGDGAAAYVLARDTLGAQFEVLDVTTQGLAHCGNGPQAISLSTRTGLLTMPNGKEVFARACQEMTRAIRELLTNNGMRLEDVRLVVPHQANKRIVDHVAGELGLPEERMALTITELGNTGCASVAITLHRYRSHLAPGDYVVLVTFGGGYSVGAALLRRLPLRPNSR